MRSTVLVAIITAAAAGFGAAFADAENIALSLLHPRGRVDIPAGAISHVEARATIAVRNTETRAVHEYPNPHVEVCFAEDVRERICQLTGRIVGEPMEIVIDCKTISKPIVREPLCTQPCFQISASDLAEATSLAQRIRNGTDTACAPPN